MNRQPELPSFIRDLEIQQSLEQYVPMPSPILDDDIEDEDAPL